MIANMIIIFYLESNLCARLLILMISMAKQLIISTTHPSDAVSDIYIYNGELIFIVHCCVGLIFLVDEKVKMDSPIKCHVGWKWMTMKTQTSTLAIVNKNLIVSRSKYIHSSHSQH